MDSSPSYDQLVCALMKGIMHTTHACLWNFNITSSDLHLYTLMAGDLWCFNFTGERFSNSTRESFTSTVSDEADACVCSGRCPPRHQGYSLEVGKKIRKTNWRQICPGVVIVEPYFMMSWQSSTKLMTLLSENVSKNNASAAAGVVLTSGWQACFWNGSLSLSWTERENCGSLLNLSQV